MALALEMENHYFDIGAHQPFAGNGVILGTDGVGDSVDAKSDIDWVKDHVRFGHPLELGPS